jgi:hypothetical protein
MLFLLFFIHNLGAAFGFDPAAPVIHITRPGMAAVSLTQISMSDNGPYKKRFEGHGSSAVPPLLQFLGGNLALYARRLLPAQLLLRRNHHQLLPDRLLPSLKVFLLTNHGNNQLRF